MSAPDSSPPAVSRRGVSVGFLLSGALLLLLLGLVGWNCIWRLGNSAAVQRLTAAAHERGEPVTLKELADFYRLPAGETNAAEALLDLWESEEPTFWRAFRSGSRSLPRRVEPQYDPDLPFLGKSSDRLPRSAVLSPKSQAAAEEFVRVKSNYLAAVRTAAQAPGAHFPVRVRDGITALLPHLAQLKRDGQWFRVQAILALGRGDADAALASLEGAAEVGHTLQAEPFLISQLVRMACYVMVVDGIERVLCRRALTPAQLDRAAALLAQLEQKRGLWLAFLGERAADISLFGLSAKEIEAMGEFDDGGGSIVVGAMGLYGATGLKGADRRFIMETMSEAIRLAAESTPEADRQLKALLAAAPAKARASPPKLIARLLLPALEKTPIKFAVAEARRRAALAAVEVERFRAAHEGRLPVKLDELVPAFLPAVPTDPFDGAPLRFKPLAKGYVVYSVGADHHDDGGRERPHKGRLDQFDETFTVER